MTVKLPTIRELIREFGVARTDRTCDCCFEFTLFEIPVPMVPGHPSPGDIFLVCQRCDVVK
jgi:hypothetical protein